jgi:hypothetical protein
MVVLDTHDTSYESVVIRREDGGFQEFEDLHAIPELSGFVQPKSRTPHTIFGTGLMGAVRLVRAGPAAGRQEPWNEAPWGTLHGFADSRAIILLPCDG